MEDPAVELPLLTGLTNGGAAISGPRQGRIDLQFRTILNWKLERTLLLTQRVGRLQSFKLQAASVKPLTGDELYSIGL